MCCRLGSHTAILPNQYYVRLYHALFFWKLQLTGDFNREKTLPGIGATTVVGRHNHIRGTHHHRFRLHSAIQEMRIYI